MTLKYALSLSAGLLALGIAGAQAQEPLKIGVVSVLTGPQAALGQQVRDGFQLSVDQLGGKFGGRPVQITVIDDELKPDVAVSKVRSYIESGKVDFVVGPVFSNILGAIAKPVLDSGAFLISPNAGPSTLAGKACNQNFFVTSYQNDQVHEVLGKYAQDQGFKKAYIMAPNYQAGKDSLAGFKNYFKGEIVDEVYVPLTQLDFSAELAKIAAAKPDVVFAFMPGGLGVNLVKQWSQAGLTGKIPFLSAFTVDESTLPAQQDAAIGLFGGMTWAPNMDNPQTKKFVADYEAAYKIVPGSYAQQAYDAGLLIDSALKATKGDTSDKDKLRAAIKKADFTSLRGKFKFNTNGFPIQDFYLVKVAKRPDGKFQTEIAQKVFSDYADPHAKDCGLK
ncbi:ABC transporter substrate-binding protein [Bosea caraganae]|uniref:ABC transporter substrate-binding protein n=1 Tax=Bosea caraganae TaxID=2763117 RepID=A0A370L3Q7_9HYPH|nr:ABC transporter substrate-binding protein [Bosea caraganae]RDJ23046.1 ABC transporter substrate-binding protein [Bosea caraganae]RDJ28826.1 ABC transporter substrate-binding protein [Bosea caraganae]